MEIEKIYQIFMDFVSSHYDGLAYTFQFSTFKRLTMDRSSYLKAAEHFFEEYDQTKLIDEDALTTLINEFNKKVKIVEMVVRK